MKIYVENHHIEKLKEKLFYNKLLYIGVNENERIKLVKKFVDNSIMVYHADFLIDTVFPILTKLELVELFKDNNFILKLCTYTKFRDIICSKNDFFGKIIDDNTRHDIISRLYWILYISFYKDNKINLLLEFTRLEKMKDYISNDTINVLKNLIIEISRPINGDYSNMVDLFYIQLRLNEVEIIPYNKIIKEVFNSTDASSIYELLDTVNLNVGLNRLFNIRNYNDEKLSKKEISTVSSNRYVFLKALAKWKPELLLEFDLEKLYSEIILLNDPETERELVKYISARMYNIKRSAVSDEYKDYYNNVAKKLGKKWEYVSEEKNGIDNYSDGDSQISECKSLK